MTMYGDKEHFPMISVITPSLNKGKYIEKCLLSICYQSYRNWEHIVVDGGSTDGTLEIVQNYNHVQLICEPDTGMYDAINKGIRASKGDIIAYLNCDDRYFSDTLLTVVDVFSNNRDVDFVYGYCSYIDTSDNEIFFMRSIPFWSFLLKAMTRFPWSQPSTFWRRRVHDRIGFFDTQYKIIGDRDFFLRIIRSGCHGRLIRKKLSQFMLANSFATPDGRLFEYNKLLGTLEIRRSILARCFEMIGELLFKVSNVDNYIKRGIRYRQRR